MKVVFATVFFIFCLRCLAQTNSMSNGISQEFVIRNLNYRYKVDNSLKPGALVADFNSDGKIDTCVFVFDKINHKKGLLLLLGGSKSIVVFGAGNYVGIKGVDATDNLKWVSKWHVQKKRIIYKPIFNKEGDIIGAKKLKIPNVGIAVWSTEDGEEMAGSVIFWNGKNWEWIHQGE